MFIKKIAKQIKEFLEVAAALILPRSCIICNKIIGSGHLCVDDFNQLQFLQKPACVICFQPFTFEVEKDMCCAACLAQKPKYDKAISVFKYDEFSKKFILAFKYGDRIYLSKFFAQLMFIAAKEIIADIDFVTPIALHKKRLKKRKYNHSALIAKDFAKISKINLIYDLLIRQKNTSSQLHLNKIARRKNLKGAFKFNDKYFSKIQQKNILIIDDVITTGATIDNYCKVLRKVGVGKIYVLTLAKTIID